MAQEPAPLMTAGAIAKDLGSTDAKVKKAIQALGLQPTAKKGCCNYYSADLVSKIKGAL